MQSTEDQVPTPDQPEEGTATFEKKPVAPVSSANRIHYLDELRGFALLGILIMNIQNFSMILASSMNPVAQGPSEGLNQLTYWYTHLFADMKMMSLFSMLFGAGMLLFIEKAKERRGKSIGLHHRRMLWLLVFGLIHAYFIWRGDILVVYAVAGVIIYWFKNASPTWLIITGVIFFLFLASIQLSLGVFWDVIPEEQLVEVIEIFQPEQETIDEEVAAYSGSFLETHKRRVIDAWDMHQSLFGFIWRVLANMLFGMALFKMGILKGEKSRKFYRNFMLLGFGIGFPLIAAGIVQNFANNWDTKFYFAYGFQFNYFGSIFVAFGYIGLIALWSKSDFLTDLKRRLAAVGRMAFTNYIMQSIICTIIFYGFGFGLFNQIERFPQQLIVLAIWVFQLAISPWWLKRYRFGPLEWLWRTLTYWKRQPLRRF
jgi:uncharacterized protein